MARRASASENELYFAAVQNGDHKAVQSLLDTGYPVDQTKEGATALYKAAYANQIEVMKTLIAGGADVNFRANGTTQETHSRTALNIACVYGHADAVTLLLEHGANPRLVSASGETPAHLLASGYLRQLAQTPPVDLGEKFLCDALSAMLERGLPINQTNPNGHTILHRFVYEPNIPAGVIRLLLGRGADPHSRNDKGETTVHVAARRSVSSDALAVLLEHGANTEIESFEGATALHVCSAENMPLLFAHSANLEARNIDGHTPLMAKMLIHLERNTPGFVPPDIANLINAGASLDTAEHGGLTPRSLLKSSRMTAVAAFVAAHDAQAAMRTAAKKAMKRTTA